MSRQPGLGRSRGFSPTRETFQAPLSSGLPPCPIPTKRKGATLQGLMCTESEAAPCKMAAAGGGRAEPEKASIYKAPSSLLHPRAWSLGAGSHSSMGDPVGLPPPGEGRPQGPSPPPPPQALQALARSGARAPQQQETGRSGSSQMWEIEWLPYQHWEGSHLPDELRIPKGLQGPSIPTRAGVTRGV